MKSPCSMSYVSPAAVDSHSVYVRVSEEVIYACSVEVERLIWSLLPLPCPSSHCPLVIINNLLTSIGGSYGGDVTNKLLSLSTTKTMWFEKFPPMPTNRSDAAALCTGAALIVAGGDGGMYGELTTVEVMDVETQQWSTASCLPIPMHCAPMILCGQRIFILSKKMMYTCSLNSLSQSCTSKSVRVYLARSLSVPSEDSARLRVWMRVNAPLAVTHATFVSLDNWLLAIGGKDSSHRATTAIRMYNPTNRSWDIISEMSRARSNCVAAVLPSNQLMVVGGCVDGSRSLTDSMELAASVILKEPC